MKRAWVPIKITGLKEGDNQTIIQATTEESKDNILKYATDKGLYAEIKLDDGRQITSEQRKKLYATFKDIADYTGDIPEYTKELFKFMFCADSDQEHFSLSDCSMEVARDFINYIIEFVIMHDIPLSELATERTDDIGKYLFYTLKHQKCCICGSKGIIYTLDQDKNKMCLCDAHHDMAKIKGLQEFCEGWKVYGIQYLG